MRIGGFLIILILATAIISIVTEVTTAVNNIDECLTKTLNFIDTSVMKDYDNFTNISNTYHSDAESFQSTLEEITPSLKRLELATNEDVLKCYMEAKHQLLKIYDIH